MLWDGRVPSSSSNIILVLDLHPTLLKFDPEQIGLAMQDSCLTEFLTLFTPADVIEAIYAIARDLTDENERLDCLWQFVEERCPVGLPVLSHGSDTLIAFEIVTEMIMADVDRILIQKTTEQGLPGLINQLAFECWIGHNAIFRTDFVHSRWVKEQINDHFKDAGRGALHSRHTSDYIERL